MNRNYPQAELELRVARLQQLLDENGYDAMVVSTNANIFYTAGFVFCGFVYIPVSGAALYFVRRPVDLKGDSFFHIKKPEQIMEVLQKAGCRLPQRVAFELDRIPYSEAERLAKAFAMGERLNASPLLSAARAVKTDFEVELVRESGMRHCRAYKNIPKVYSEGMTDAELQFEIERLLRLEGCLGLFRIAGESMETFMGTLLAGDNADEPSPYDFAMGGAGLDNSLPMGCNGSVIRPGDTVLVDLCGNFTGYMTDMTRSFYVHRLDEKAEAAHRLSIEIHKRLAATMKPGTSAKDAYNTAMEMVVHAGFEDYYMGHRQHAGFIGHGVGIEINEWPVIAPRSKHVLEKGNVIAIEPKFVIPGVGAVGIENTYLVADDGLVCLTNLDEEIIAL